MYVYNTIIAPFVSELYRWKFFTKVLYCFCCILALTTVVGANLPLVFRLHEIRLVDHGLLLYKRCAKSMGRPKFRLPTAPTFFTDLNETWNQERYSGYDPTCKIGSMWDDGKGVCVVRAFSITFCVLSILFLYSCWRLQVTPEDRSRPFMAQNARFRVRRDFWGSRW